VVSRIDWTVIWYGAGVLLVGQCDAEAVAISPKTADVSPAPRVHQHIDKPKVGHVMGISYSDALPRVCMYILCVMRRPQRNKNAQLMHSDARITKSINKTLSPLGDILSRVYFVL
jgi:hypothetical protein